MCTHSAAIWLLAVVWCGGLTASTAHSAVLLPSSTSQQQRSLLKTSPAANATSCLDRAKQYLQALERNVTEPAVIPCTRDERSADRAAKDAPLNDYNAKVSKCLSDQLKALKAGRNVTGKCPDFKQPAKEDMDTLRERAEDLMNEAREIYDKAAAGKDPFIQIQKEVQKSVQEVKDVSQRYKDMERLNATSSASSPHVNVGKIVLFAIAGLAVLV